jgi:amino acid transporter
VTPEVIDLLRLIAIELMIGFGVMTILFIVVVVVTVTVTPARSRVKRMPSAQAYQPDPESELSERLHTLQRMRFAPVQGVEPVTRLSIPLQGRRTIQRKKA